jgi:heat shock protein HtpX
MIVQFGFFFGGGFDDGDDDNPSWAIVLLVSFAVYILSFFLMLALSRYREFVADRGSALITGRPSALSSALLKITGEMQRVPQKDLRAAEGMSAFFIVSPGVKSAVRTLFMDHPPTQKRIEQLSRLEAQLQVAGPRAA